MNAYSPLQHHCGGGPPLGPWLRRKPDLYRKLFRRAARALLRGADRVEVYLNALDAQADDGDTGSALASAARALLRNIDLLPLSDHAQCYHALGQKLRQTIDGSLGMLLVIFFSAVGDTASSGRDLSSALGAGLARMQEVDGAQWETALWSTRSCPRWMNCDEVWPRPRRWRERAPTARRAHPRPVPVVKPKSVPSISKDMLIPSLRPSHRCPSVSYARISQFYSGGHYHQPLPNLSAGVILQMPQFPTHKGPQASADKMRRNRPPIT
jgi:hypothetical protein